MGGDGSSEGVRLVVFITSCKAGHEKSLHDQSFVLRVREWNGFVLFIVWNRAVFCVCFASESEMPLSLISFAGRSTSSA